MKARVRGDVKVILYLFCHALIHFCLTSLKRHSLYNPNTLLYKTAYFKKTGMTQQQVLLVQKTWKLFRDIKPEIVGDVFYSKLFTDVPALRRLFKNPMISQYKKLIDTLSMIV